MFNIKLYAMSIDYKQLANKEGWNFLSKIQTVFLTKDPDLWVNPFENIELRYRSLFFNIEKRVYIYITLGEIQETGCLADLLISSEIFLAGAYNQIEVCQMRSLGKIGVVEGERKKWIISLLEKRLDGEKIICDNFEHGLIYPDEKERGEAIGSLKSEGILYYFCPISYSYNIYQRG